MYFINVFINIFIISIAFVLYVTCCNVVSIPKTLKMNAKEKRAFNKAQNAEKLAAQAIVDQIAATLSAMQPTEAPAAEDTPLTMEQQIAAALSAMQPAQVVTMRKLPTKLSKSQLISLFQDAGYSVKQVVALSDVFLAAKLIPEAFNAGHVRNSFADFAKNEHKAKNARLTAASLSFSVPSLIAMQPEAEDIAQAASEVAGTTIAEK